MNIIKKLMSVFLVVCFLFSTIIYVYADENAELGYEFEEKEEKDPYELGNQEMTEDSELQEEIILDVEEDISDDAFNEMAYEESIAAMNEFSLLTALGVDINNESKEKLICRDEAAMMLALLSNRSDLPDADKTYFTDVEISNKYLKYINYGYERSYFSGVGNGQFAPTRGITTIEFVTAVLRSAGYIDYAEAAGGYSDKYLLIAMKYDLLDGVSGKTSDVLTMQDAIKIMANALDLPYCEMTAIQGGNAIYTMEETQTLLNVNFDIKKYVGILCSTPDASISQCSRTPEGLVALSINGNINEFGYENADAYRYLGQSVFAYADSNNFIYHIESRYDLKNEFIQFNQISKVAPDRTRIDFVNENGKRQTVNIAYDAVFIKNGKEERQLAADELMLPNSSIELIDADRDGKYDVVIYEIRQIILAERLFDPIYTWGINYTSSAPISNEMYPIELMKDWINNSDYYKGYTVSQHSLGKSVQLDPNSDKYSLELLMNGNEIEYKDIKIGDILSVCDSIDGEKRKVYVSRNSVNAKISVIDEENRIIETSDGEEYVYSFDMGSKLLLGKTATIYLDHYGIAVAYKLIDTGSIAYGYLLDYACTGKGVAKVWQAEIYTMDRTAKVYDFAEKFKHNDVKEEPEQFENYFNSTGHQLVKYSVNDEGKINKIYTSYTPEGYNLRSEKPIFVLNEHYNGDTGNVGIGLADITFEYEYDMRSVHILEVVVDENGDVVEDGVNFVSSFAERQKQDLRVYDATVGKDATFMVCTVSESEKLTHIGESGKTVVIGDARYDENGKFLVGMSHNGNKPYLINLYEYSEGVFDGVICGDVIRLQRFLTDEEGRYNVTDYEKIFTLEIKAKDDITSTICADFLYTNETPAVLGDCEVIYGDVVALGPIDTTGTIETRQYSVVIQPEGTFTGEECYVFTYNRESNKGGAIFKYNKGDDSLETREGYALKAGDKIFATIRNRNINFAVIYE